MKTFTAISTLLLSAVSAAPVDTRQAEPTEFDIINFSANTTPHGTGAHISYTITIPNIITTQCVYNDQSSVSNLPDVSFLACDDASVDWQFRHEPSQPGTSGPYLIVVRYTLTDGSGKKVAGFKEWPASDFPVEQNGAAFSQHFRGEPDFVIGNLS